MFGQLLDFTDTSAKSIPCAMYCHLLNGMIITEHLHCQCTVCAWFITKKVLSLLSKFIFFGFKKSNRLSMVWIFYHFTSLPNTKDLEIVVVVVIIYDNDASSLK